MYSFFPLLHNVALRAHLPSARYIGAQLKRGVTETARGGMLLHYYCTHLRLNIISYYDYYYVHTRVSVSNNGWGAQDNMFLVRYVQDGAKWCYLLSQVS